MKGRFLCGASAVAFSAVACLYVTPSRAAEAAAATEAGPSTVGELVVTAEKRSENIETVPVAVSAFSSQQRDLLGIVSAPTPRRSCRPTPCSPTASRCCADRRARSMGATPTAGRSTTSPFARPRITRPKCAAASTTTTSSGSKRGCRVRSPIRCVPGGRRARGGRRAARPWPPRRRGHRQ